MFPLTYSRLVFNKSFSLKRVGLYPPPHPKHHHWVSHPVCMIDTIFRTILQTFLCVATLPVIMPSLIHSNYLSDMEFDGLLLGSIDLPFTLRFMLKIPKRTNHFTFTRSCGRKMAIAKRKTRRILEGDQGCSICKELWGIGYQSIKPSVTLVVVSVGA